MTFFDGKYFRAFTLTNLRLTTYLFLITDPIIRGLYPSLFTGPAQSGCLDPA
jgi:hypothetical protein